MPLPNTASVPKCVAEIGLEPMSAVETLFTVTEESADDPESNRTWTGISAAGIRAEWPLFAALFPDCCENSLDFVAELNRWRISPEFDS